jgi:hypothetical protein
MLLRGLNVRISKGIIVFFLKEKEEPRGMPTGTDI